MALGKKYDGLEVAIIGISGQFPGSDDHKEFWQNLQRGDESIATFTDAELRSRGVSEHLLLNKLYIKSAGVLRNKNLFDNVFFGYSAEEAALMDPQIRLFHEHCWSALEDAAYSSKIDKTKIGLFAGASVNNNWKIYANGKFGTSSVDPFYSNMIATQSYISSLVSYKLNLRGPSIYIDTACSTSLVAVHLACRNLLTKECSIALAGGILINTLKEKGYLYEEGMINSSDGHCRAFDKEASGAIGGEGVGVVVLKRLSEAINDGDHIYAIIKGSAINNDGNGKVGYTAPSVNGQMGCIIAAQKAGGVDPSTVTYIEAHGTGTRLGDPIEIKALNEAFRVGGKNKFCAIGSVKTNIGHLDTAAGVTGLIKTALSLKHRQIPASLHYTSPNPEIDFSGGPFYVNTELQDWKARDGFPLRAGVSSFGIGGTNAHVVLEEAPDYEESNAGRSYQLLTVSAKTESSLVRYLSSLKSFLMDNEGLNLADMSYTLQVGRKHFGYRKSLVYQDRSELLGLLAGGKDKVGVIHNKERTGRMVFMFSGQGSQYVNMGKDLYLSEALFREEMDKGFSLLHGLTGENFKEILYPSTGASPDLRETRYAQPLIFLLEYSLARVMIDLGISPDYMIGHSLGEYVAACISGVFTFEEGLGLVVKRGELMNSLAPGSMISVPVSASEAGNYVSKGVSLAAVNGPEQVVFSGDSVSVGLLIAKLDASGIPHVVLHTSHAFHSEMQDPIINAFKKELESISFRKPVIPFVSNLTGKLIGEEEACSVDYWLRHLRETVKFSDGLESLLGKEPGAVFIEIGAGHSLTSLLKQQSAFNEHTVGVNLLASFSQRDDDVKYLTGQLGKLWSHGVAIDWSVYYKTEKRRKVSLPTYCFEPLSYPAEVDPFSNGFLSGLGLGNSGTQELKDWLYYPEWKRSVLRFSGSVPMKRSYLFFSPGGDFGNALKAELISSGHALIEVLAGERYHQESKDQYTVPLSSAGIGLMMSELRRSGISITDFVYGWSMGLDSSRIALAGDNKELNLSYFSLVRILQELLHENELQEKRLIVLTDSLHKVIGNEKISYGPSLLLGLLNVLPQEHSVLCCNIDVCLEEGPGTLGSVLAKELSDELPDRILALRYGQRWVQDYQRNTQSLIKDQSLVKRAGVYLITGGLGNVGFVLAKHLLEEYGAKVILTGRTDVYGSGEEESSGLSRLTYLQSLGGSVEYFTADVSSLGALEEVVDDVERRLLHIDGIIHAAGVIDTGYFELIEEISVDRSLAVFAPKVNGIAHIYELFKDRSADFVWVTSSLSSVLGGLSFSAYSSANLFMNHFIASKSDELKNWRCISLSGMVFTDEHIQREVDSPLKREALIPSEIVSLFEWSLSVRDTPLLLESIEDLYLRIEKAYATLSKDAVSDPGSSSRAERPALSSSYVAPGTDTERKIIGMLEDFFGIEGIGVEDNFFELGGDSLKAMVLIKRLKKEFNINIPLKEFFQRQTIREIAEFINEIHYLLKKNNRTSRKIV